MRQRLMSFAVAIVMASAPVAFAQVAPIWSAAGVTGVVDESDQSMLQFNSTGSVSIKAAASGTLDIRYPMQTLEDLLIPQQGDCPELNAVLRDTGSGSRVIVRLMQLGVRSGFEGQLTRLAEIDSDRLPPISDPTRYRSGRVCIGAAPGSEFVTDYSFYTYYVEVQLIKTTSTANPGLMALQICPSQDRCEP